MSGGGGSSAPTQQTITQTTIPDWAKPYATKVLGEAENLAYNQPYQAYTGQRLAGLNPLQQQGILQTQQMTPASQLNQATGLAGMAGLEASQFGKYQPAQYSGMDLSYRLASPERVRANKFGLSSVQPYMSPYMQDVVESEKSQAIQDYARQIPGLQAQGIRAGARGGTREALLQSEAQRNLMNQLGGIQAQGTQQAYQQGMQQYNIDQAQRMQAALANQQFGLQAQQANQQAQLQAQQQALGQQQFANEFGEKSRQFGANLGLQGLQQQLAAAGTLGNLGQTQYGQQMGINQAQMATGQQLQAFEQQQRDMAYQEFLNRQRYPYAQLGFISDVIRGTPASGAISTMYQAPPSPLSQVAGLGALYYGSQKQ